MLNPTCPQCNTPIATRDTMLVMGQVAIWLQCDNGHDVVEIVPVSRFTLTFGDVDNGDLFCFDGCLWLKTREWSREGFNASYRGGNEPRDGLFIRVVSTEQVHVL